MITPIGQKNTSKQNQLIESKNKLLSERASIESYQSLNAQNKSKKLKHDADSLLKELNQSSDSMINSKN